MVVDCHAHVVPYEIIKMREQYVNEREKEVYAIYSNPLAKMVGMEELLKVMDDQGVDKAIIFGLPWSSHELMKLNNDYILEACKKYPHRFIGFCCVDVDAKEALKEVERCLSEGLKGVGELAFYSSDIDSRKRKVLTKIAHMCKEADVPVMLHTNEEVGHMYPGKSPMTLRNLYKLIKENPDTRWILAHMGGGLPFFAYMKKEVEEVIENCWFDTAALPYLYKPSVYNALIDVVKEKILFGTDFPLLEPKRYYKEFEKSGINKDIVNMFLKKNPAKLLGI